MKVRYSYDLLDAVESKIPRTVLDELHRLGWNVLGVYEVVADELKRQELKSLCEANLKQGVCSCGKAVGFDVVSQNWTPCVECGVQSVATCFACGHTLVSDVLSDKYGAYCPNDDCAEGNHGG